MQLNSRLLSAYHATRRSIFTHQKIVAPRVAITLITRNEADLLDPFLRFHSSIGAEYFSIVDNGSTDNTQEIVQKYKNDGFVRDYIKIDGPFDQVRFVNYLNEIIKGRQDADWIINSDTDEFWFPKNLDLSSIFSMRSENVLRIKSYNFLPSRDGVFYNSVNRVQKYDNTKINTIFSPNLSKVAYRVKDFIEISDGNHQVNVNNKSLSEVSDLEVFHFPIRSKEQLKAKYVAHQRRINRNLPEHLKAMTDKLSEGFSYDEVFQMSYPDDHGIQKMLQDGILISDRRLYDALV